MDIIMHYTIRGLLYSNNVCNHLILEQFMAHSTKCGIRSYDHSPLGLIQSYCANSQSDYRSSNATGVKSTKYAHYKNNVSGHDIT